MPDADFALLEKSIRDAGQMALTMRAGRFGHSQKPDGTIITDIDLAVDDLLRSRIRTARPDDGWLSEETPDSSERLGKRRLWIVDPIDGTRGLLHGSGPWGIGIALVIDGQPMLSAIFQPADDLLFHAARGAGVQINGKHLMQHNARSVIAARRYRTAIETAGFAAETDSPIPLLLRLASIARGQHAGAVSLGNKNDWDIAAGHLMVTESGGAVTALDGSDVIYNRPAPWQPGLVAAASLAIHAALCQAVRGS